MAKVKKLPKIVPDEIGMKTYGVLLQDMLPNKYGFILQVFPFGEGGMTNYISNAQRADVIKCLRETADMIEKGRTFMPPNQN